MPPTATTSRCKGCNNPVRIARTRAREIVLEPDPDLDGNVDLQLDGVAVPLSPAKVTKARSAGLPLYLEHECTGRPAR